MIPATAAYAHYHVAHTSDQNSNSTPAHATSHVSRTRTFLEAAADPTRQYQRPWMITRNKHKDKDNDRDAREHKEQQPSNKRREEEARHGHGQRTHWNIYPNKLQLAHAPVSPSQTWESVSRARSPYQEYETKQEDVTPRMASPTATRTIRREPIHKHQERVGNLVLVPGSREIGYLSDNKHTRDKHAGVMHKGKPVPRYAQSLQQQMEMLMAQTQGVTRYGAAEQEEEAAETTPPDVISNASRPSSASTVATTAAPTTSHTIALASLRASTHEMSLLHTYHITPVEAISFLQHYKHAGIVFASFEHVIRAVHTEKRALATYMQHPDCKLLSTRIATADITRLLEEGDAASNTLYHVHTLERRQQQYATVVELIQQIKYEEHV